MKRMPKVLIVIASAFLMSACASGMRNASAGSSNPGHVGLEHAVTHAPVSPAQRADQLSIDDGSGNKVLIQRVAFRPGVSSITVERLARRYGCEGGAGAGLVTGKGPREMYRMNCNNGRVFLAKCELRQCQAAR
jgi:hypothetical protein